MKQNTKKHKIPIIFIMISLIIVSGMILHIDDAFAVYSEIEKRN